MTSEDPSPTNQPEQQHGADADAERVVADVAALGSSEALRRAPRMPVPVPSTAPSMTLASNGRRPVERRLPGAAHERGDASGRSTSRWPGTGLDGLEAAPVVDEVAEDDADEGDDRGERERASHLTSSARRRRAALAAAPTTGSSQCVEVLVVGEGQVEDAADAAPMASTTSGSHISHGDSCGFTPWPWSACASPCVDGLVAMCTDGLVAMCADGLGTGLVPAGLAEEHHDHLAGHVVGGEEGGDEADEPEDRRSCRRRRAGSRPSTRSRRTAARRRWPASRR